MNKWGIYEARSDPDHISYRHNKRRMAIPTKQCIYHQIVNKDLAVGAPMSHNSSNSIKTVGSDRGRCYCSVSKSSLTHIDKKSKMSDLRLVKLNLFRSICQVGSIPRDRLNDPNYCLEQESDIDDLESYTMEGKMSSDEQVPKDGDDTNENVDSCTEENEMDVEKVEECNSTGCEYCEFCDTTMQLSAGSLNSIYDIVT